MAETEVKFEKKVRKQLMKLPKTWILEKDIGTSVRGRPDIIGVVNGRFIALELKRSMADMLHGSDRQKLQEFVLDKIQHAGGYASFVTPETWPQIHLLLREMAHGH